LIAQRKVGRMKKVNPKLETGENSRKKGQAVKKWCEKKQKWVTEGRFKPNTLGKDGGEGR